MRGKENTYLLLCCLKGICIFGKLLVTHRWINYATAFESAMSNTFLLNKSSPEFLFLLLSY